MGGFMEYEGNRPIRVLFPHELESYSLTGNGEFPRISKAEIQEQGRCHLERCRHSSNRLVCDTMHHPRSPRPTDHRIGTHHGCVRSSELCDIHIVVGEAAERATWSAGIQKTNEGEKVHLQVRLKIQRLLRHPIIHRFQLRLPVDPIWLPSSTRRGPFVLLWRLFKPFYILFSGYGGDSTIFQKRVNTFYPHERVEGGLTF